MTASIMTAIAEPGVARESAITSTAAVCPYARLSRQNVQRLPARVNRVAVRLMLDLHDFYNRGNEIDRALRAVIDDAVRTKATVVEIIPGKGSGQLKKRVLRFLDQEEVKALYHRVEKDSDNFGRVLVHFRWPKPGR